MTDMRELAVKVEHLTKTFKIPTEASSGVKQKLINYLKGKKGYREFTPLKDVSFEIEKGDFFGIVGRNGSGKSTLLKSIANIYTPTKGGVHVNGTLVPFIELGVGFNPELTGRENVFMNGALLGFSHTEMVAMYDEIVEFAEIKDFMDEKLKNYSSGMQVRLAFSIAVKAEGDILLLDEVLAVGDEAFQRKCNNYFYDLKRNKKTVILVTHSMEAVRNLCNKAVLIDEGKIVASGNPDEVAGQYSKMFQEEYIEQKQSEEVPEKKAVPSSDVSIEAIRIIEDEKDTNVVGFRKDFSIEFTITASKEYENLVMGVHLVNQAGQTVTAISTKTFRDKLHMHKGTNTYKFDIQNIFAEGGYSLNVAIMQRDAQNFLVQEHDIYKFSIIGIDASRYNLLGLVYPDVKLDIKK